MAISQAGAFIKNTASGIPEYIKFYENDWGKLMDIGERLREPSEVYPARSITTTWHISYEHIRQTDKAATFLLELWACLDPGDIWFDLFASVSKIDASSWPHLPEHFSHFQNAMRNEIDFAMVRQTLLAYSLVESKQATQEFSMHPVVHEWMYRWVLQSMDSTIRSELVCLALKVVGDAVPVSNQKEYWVLQQKLLRHANRCISRYREIKYSQYTGVEPVDQRLVHSLNDLGILYADQSMLKEAERFYGLALKGREEAFGPNNLSTLETVNNLGNLYSNQGKLIEAEVMYRRALEGYENALDSNISSILDTVNNLGSLYSSQDKLKDAEDMYKRALEGYENDLGPNNPSTLRTVNNLGNLYSKQGRLEEAEEMYQRAIVGYENALGPNNPSTLVAVTNLGNLYFYYQGKLKEAEEMYQQALRGKKEALGPNHTSTLDTVNNLGILYAERGKLEEAEEMYKQALGGYENALGSNHSSTLDIVSSLGDLYSNQGKLKEAEGMYKRAQTGYEETLGPSHELVSSVANKLKSLRDHQNRVLESSGFEENHRRISGSRGSNNPTATNQNAVPQTSPVLERASRKRSLSESEMANAPKKR